MASLKDKKKAVVEEEVKVEGDNNGTVVQYMNKVSNEEKPSLRAYFSMRTDAGVFTRATFTEKEIDEDNSQFGVMFPSYTYENKEGKKIRKDYIHPIDAKTRLAIVDSLVKTFTKVYQEEWAEDEELQGDGVIVKYPKEKENEKFKSLRGDASITVTRPMVINNCELHQRKDGTFFVVYPANHYTDSPIYGPASKEANAAITEAAVVKYKEEA